MCVGIETSIEFITALSGSYRIAKWLNITPVPGSGHYPGSAKDPFQQLIAADFRMNANVGEYCGQCAASQSGLEAVDASK